MNQNQRYQQKKRLGGGVTGEVWLAADTVLGRDVAIKYLNAVDDEVHRELFMAEARMLARLHHPGITTLFDAALGDEGYYLIMEYVNGHPLNEVVGDYGFEDALDIAISILNALRYAHEHGVVHRDIKPDNVMIAADGVVKLTDFGFANLLSIVREKGEYQLGTSINGNLYYPLLDPSGTSLTLVDANGDEAGHILYDAYGGVLSSTVAAADLAAALSSQGATADPATGLVHLGGGRFYDPALGRPLQPNPAGSVPTVPQSLNRYGATSLGAVAEGVINTWDPFNDPIASNVGKSLIAATTLVPWQGVERGLAAYSRASLQATSVVKTRFRRVPISQAVDNVILDIGTAGALLKDLIGAPAGSGRAQFFGLGYEWFLLAARWNSRFVPERYTVSVLRHRYPGGRLAGKISLRLGGPLDELGIGILINVGYQAWLDYDNPYLSSTQYRRRLAVAGVAGGIGTIAGISVTSYLGGATAGAFLGGPAVWAGIVAGTVVGMGLDVIGVPLVYDALELYPTRNLAPLQE